MCLIGLKGYSMRYFLSGCGCKLIMEWIWLLLVGLVECLVLGLGFFTMVILSGSSHAVSGTLLFLFKNFQTNYIDQ